MSYWHILKTIVSLCVLLFSFSQTFATDNIFSDSWEVPFCGDNECGYQAWVNEVKDMVENAETDKPLSEYIQDVIVYLLTFLSIIAVIYIIYAWLRILLWWWNDDAVKNSRKTILHVVIWIAIIWLAYSIVAFIIDIFYTASKTGT